jgi:hypothetical protein
MAVEGKRELVPVSLLPLNPAARETREPEPEVTIPASAPTGTFPSSKKPLAGNHQFPSPEFRGYPDFFFKFKIVGLNKSIHEEWICETICGFVTYR